MTMTRRKKERIKRLQQAQQLRQLDDSVLTFSEWCALNGIGDRTGRRIRASGRGPVFVQLSEKRVGVTLRANREWQQSRART